MTLLLSALAGHAAATPRKPFFLFGKAGEWSQFSYQDTLDEVMRWARHLAALKLPSGSLLCIALPHAPELYFLYLGAMRIGLTPSFLAHPTPKQDPAIYWSGLTALLDQIEPACLVIDEEHLAQVRAISNPDCVVTSRGELRETAGPDAGLPALADCERPDGIALLQHSSGTTGARKSVALTYEQIRQQIVAYSDAISADGRDKIVSWLPLYHDMGLVTGFLMPLTLGAMVVSLDPFEWVVRPEIFFKAIAMVGGTLAWLPNFAFAHMVRVHDPDQLFVLDSVRALVNCSEPCKPAVFADFLNSFSSSGIRREMLQTCYAMAETVFAVTQSDLADRARIVHVSRAALRVGRQVEPVAASSESEALLSCGRPIAGVDVAIRAEDGIITRRPGAIGEITVMGDFVFSGYRNSPDDMARIFDGSHYRTGDIGFLLDGELFVTGRSKELIIIHGRNFYAHDIEAIVGQVKGIKPGRVVAFGLFDDVTSSEELVILAETAGEPAADLDALRRLVRAHVFSALELSARTVRFYPPNILVKTTSGKISRQENKVRYCDDASPELAGA